MAWNNRWVSQEWWQPARNIQKGETPSPKNTSRCSRHVCSGVQISTAFFRGLKKGVFNTWKFSYGKCPRKLACHQKVGVSTHQNGEFGISLAYTICWASWSRWDKLLEKPWRFTAERRSMALSFSRVTCATKGWTSTKGGPSKWNKSHTAA